MSAVLRKNPTFSTYDLQNFDESGRGDRPFFLVKPGRFSHHSSRAS
jgi:hypothetical protein